MTYMQTIRTFKSGDNEMWRIKFDSGLGTKHISEQFRN